MTTRRTELAAFDPEPSPDGTVFVLLHLIETEDGKDKEPRKHRTGIAPSMAPAQQLALVNRQLARLHDKVDVTGAPIGDPVAWPPVGDLDARRIRLKCDEELAKRAAVDDVAAELARAQAQIASLTAGYETLAQERNEARAAAEVAEARARDAEGKADIRGELHKALAGMAASPK